MRILLCFRFKFHEVLQMLDDDDDVDLLGADKSDNTPVTKCLQPWNFIRF